MVRAPQLELHGELHGGNALAAARRLGCRPGQLVDASASLVPFGLPWPASLALLQAGCGGPRRSYPDRDYGGFRQAAARLHGLDPAWVLPGNGASELFTWAARDGAAAGANVLLQPGFADYGRALACWGAAVVSHSMPLEWSSAFPQPYPDLPPGQVLWITNPHNPTGQLWSAASLEPLLARYRLVICDEAFLPLAPGGEAQSLVPLLGRYPNLVVICSLTKLYGIAGLRLGYALANPERLQRWATWRDPWPVNGLAAALGEQLLADPGAYRRWCERVRHWVSQEGRWWQAALAPLPGIAPLPSAANFLLIRGASSLVPLREQLECRHRILLRDCRSFAGLGDRWLRVGYQSRPRNRRILRALRQALNG